MHELFRKTVGEKPGSRALMFFGKAVSYGELGGLAESAAQALMKTGISRGDRVALLLPNCPQFVIAYYGILMAGATVVPVNPLSTETELLHIFRDGEVKAVIALDLLAGRLESVRDRCREAGEAHLLVNTYYTSLKEFMPFPLSLLYPLKQKLPPAARERLSGGGRFGDLLKDKPGKSPAVDFCGDTAVLIYTGGTTGKPKGVMLSHHNLVVNAMQCAAWGGISTEDSILAVLPVFHGFGMSVCMNATVINGGTCVLLPRYEVGDLLKSLHRYRPTLFAGVPTMYNGLINHPDIKKYDLTSLRGCFVGAAALAPEIKRRFEDLTGGNLMEGYGLTEAVTAICCNPYRGVNKTGSIGIPFPNVVMKIRDLENERDLPPGEVGELIIQAPDVMLGYYNRADETAEALKDGWLHTGDMGYMDEEGYFYIVDRKKDMIITGGFNVYPREVEDVLYQHSAVNEASVIGVPDQHRGEMVKAYVTLKEGCAAAPEEIISFCREHLLPYKVPRQVEIRGELPKSVIGKILKKTLREQNPQ
jgi:long-chain acyl-CoA synthetase